jgi:hypothetical protein
MNFAESRAKEFYRLCFFHLLIAVPTRDLLSTFVLCIFDNNALSSCLCPSGVFAKDSNNSKEIIRKTLMTKRVSLIIPPNSGPGIF